MTIKGQTGLADDAAIQRTVAGLQSRKIDAVVVGGGEAAKEKLIELVPPGAEIFNSSSETLDLIGYTDYVRRNPRYRNLHDAMEGENDPAKQREVRRRATIAEYFIGSVQAVAETGEIVVASSSGSQIAAYAFGARHVIWVAGTQKICPTLSDAVARVQGYTLGKHDRWLEDKGLKPTPIGKLLIFENEVVPGRVRLVLIKADLGW
jgi:hypothetical protein